jgi:hypothetical protein
MDELLENLTDVTNRSVNQTKFLLDLVDGDFDQLVALEYKVKNNHLSYCPGDKEEVKNVLSMGDGSGWAFDDKRYSQLKNLLSSSNG